MKRSIYVAVATLGSLLGLSCTGGDSPTDAAYPSNMASLAIAPVFAGGSNSTTVGEISRIRITVLQASDGSVIETRVVEVDPTASEWTLEFTVPIPSDPSVLVTFELISVVDGGEVVEWSGETAVTLTPGGSDVQTVEVYQGGLDVLTVTSIDVEDPGALQEGTGVQLHAIVETSRADASPVVRWTSGDPTIATVDASGFLEALLPCTVTITAAAGPESDEIDVVVDAEPITLGFVAHPTDTKVGNTITPAPSVEILDVRGDRVLTYTGAVTVESEVASGAAVTELASAAPVPGGTEGEPTSVAVTVDSTAVHSAAGLQGTTTVDAESGLAVFSDLTFDGTGLYRLRATATGLTAAESETFESFVSEGDVSIVKDVDRSLAFEGEIVRFTVTVLNHGPGDVTALTVSDLLPAGLTFVSVDPSAGGYDHTTGEWNVGALATGASAELVVDAEIASGTAGETLVNTATIESMDQLDDPTNNTASASVEVSRPVADVTITKTAAASSIREGEEISFTITVLNAGPDEATNVVVEEDLPAGLTFVSAGHTAGSFDPDELVWTIPTIPAGSRQALILSALPATGTAGESLTNTALVRPLADQDDDPSDNSASVVIDVTPALDVDMTVADAIVALEDALYVAVNIGEVAALDDFTFATARDLFEDAYTADPTNETAALGLAMTTIFVLEDDPVLRATADDWESWLDSHDPDDLISVSALVDPSPLLWNRATLPTDFGASALLRATRAETLTDIVLPSSRVVDFPPTLAEHQDLIRDIVIPAVADALTVLSTIDSPTFTFAITERMQGENPGEADVLELDMTEVFTLRAALETALATANVALAYLVTPGAWGADGFVTALTPGSTFGTLAPDGAVRLGKAHAGLVRAAFLLQDGLDFLAAESDEQSDDIIKVGEGALEDGEIPTIAEARDVLDDIEGTLEGPRTITEDLGDGNVTITVDASQFFLDPITDLKEVLPSYEVYKAGDGEGGDRGFFRFTALDLDSWTFPDPTFNGVLPDIVDSDDLKSTLGTAITDDFWDLRNPVGGDYVLITVGGVDCLAEGFPNLCPGPPFWWEDAYLSLSGGSDGEMHASFEYTFWTDSDSDLIPDLSHFRRWEGTYTATPGDPDISVVLSLTLVDPVSGPSVERAATVVDILGWTSTDAFGRLRGGTTITSFVWAGLEWVMAKQD